MKIGSLVRATVEVASENIHLTEALGIEFETVIPPGSLGRVLDVFDETVMVAFEHAPHAVEVEAEVIEPFLMLV